MDTNYIQQLKKGTLEVVLLCLVNAQETYGYEIITRLNNTCGEVLGYTREGTIYPILYRLEKNRLIKSRSVLSRANGREKKLYSITPSGRQTLSANTKYWQEYVACINSFLELSKREAQE